MTVEVLIINHRHGYDVSVHETEDLAVKELASYCRDWWEDFCTEDQPKSNDDIIEAYFEAADGRESYELQNHQVKS